MKKLKTDQAPAGWPSVTGWHCYTVILIFIVVACIGIIYHQQMEAVVNFRSTCSLNELRDKIEDWVKQMGIEEKRNEQPCYNVKGASR